MKKGELRRQNILNDLLQKECCTYKYLMETYQISERAMQLDIKELCKQGYKIKGIKAKQGYVLDKTEGETSGGYFESADAQKIRMLFIMLILQSSAKGLSATEITSRLKEYNYDGITADAKTIQTALNEMEAGRMIAASDGRYVVSTNAPIQLALSTADAIDLLNLLETCAKGHHYEKALYEIRKKLTIALFNEPDEEDVATSYVVYNKQYETAEHLSAFLEELNRYPFEKKELMITYKNRLKETVTIPYMVGNVVYSVDKDRLYLLGARSGVPTIIHWNSIEKIEVTDKANDIFRNRFYTEITDAMFSVSLEPIVHVKVQFENIFQIQQKLSHLKINRPNSVISYEDDKLIYEDDISGIYDFAGYLRRFGSGCKVLEPKELRDIMRESAERIIRAYESLEEER